MSNLDKNVRYNTDFKYLMFHQSEHVNPVSGADVNALAVQEGFFGIAQDIVINTNGQYDLTARWIRAVAPTQYEKNVPLYKIFKYTMHDISDSCTVQQMNYQAVHILLVGNFDNNPPSIAQQEAVRKIIIESVYRLPTLRDVLFHSEVESISCPGLFMRPNRAGLKKIFADARTTTDITIFEPMPVIAPILRVDASTPIATELAWTTIPAATSYKVYRKHIGINPDFSLVTTQSSTTYIDTDILILETYKYFATAVLPVTGEGPTSNIVSVVIPGAVNPNPYLYAFDDKSVIYTLDIQDRDAPNAIGSQDFSAQVDKNLLGARMFISGAPNNLLYLSTGATSQSYIYIFDYKTNMTSVILKHSFLTGIASTPIKGATGYRNGELVFRAATYVDVWNTSVPDTPAYIGAKSLYQPNTSGGWEHPDGNAYDPDSHRLYYYRGGDYNWSGRFDVCLMDEDNDTTYGGDTNLDMTGTNAVYYTLSSRLILQRRMPAHSNILWGLTDACWRAYESPLVLNPSPISTLRPYGSADFTPTSAQYGRCYLLDNRYMIMCISSPNVGRYGCYIWDLNDPVTPVFVAALGEINIGVADVAVTEFMGKTYAYLLARSNKTVTVVDITNIAFPMTISTVTLNGLSTSMRLCTTMTTPRQNTGYNGFFDASGV